MRLAAAAPTPAYKRKLFWVALLYFSEGLPLGVFFDIFPVYFRQQGVNLADIGLLCLLGLPGPSSSCGRRRSTGRVATAAGSPPRTSAWRRDVFLRGGARTARLRRSGRWVWFAIGVFTFLSATNDIATDGYTIELLDRHEYGLANGFRIGFYRVGMLFAGAVLMLSGWYGWPGPRRWAGRCSPQRR